MPKTLISALAAATILAGAMLTGRAAAMPSAAPSPAPARTALVQEAAVLCGGNGCAPVQTKQTQRKKFHPLGYTKPI
jgi:hypothetical protein